MTRCTATKKKKKHNAQPSNPTFRRLTDISIKLHYELCQGRLIPIPRTSEVKDGGNVFFENPGKHGVFKQTHPKLYYSALPTYARTSARPLPCNEMDGMRPCFRVMAVPPSNTSAAGNENKKSAPAQTNEPVVLAAGPVGALVRETKAA